MFVHHYNSTQYCNTETIFIYIHLPPDKHHISDVAKWRLKGRGQSQTVLLQTDQSSRISASLSLQSAYRAHHTTETAVIAVHDAIVRAIEDRDD